MHTGKQKQMNASYQASLVNRHIRRFTGFVPLESSWASEGSSYAGLVGKGLSHCNKMRLNEERFHICLQLPLRATRDVLCGLLGCTTVCTVNYRLLKGVPELSEHAVFRDFRYCGETADVAATKVFWNRSHQESKLKVTLPKSLYCSVQLLDQVRIGEPLFPFCSKTKQATWYWQEA